MAPVRSSNPGSDEFWVAEFDRQQARAQQNRRLVADGSGAATAYASPTGSVPTVSGVSITAQVQGIKVTWNDVSIRDLLRYDVQISNNSTFTGTADAADHATDNYSETFRVRDNQKTLPALNADVTLYYVRVRAVNTANNRGAYSNVASTSVSGAIGTTDITGAAVSSVSSVTDATTETLNNSNGGSVDTDDVEVNGADANTVVIINMTTSFDFASFWSSTSSVNNADLILQRSVKNAGSYTDLQTITLDFKSTIPTDITAWGGGSPADTSDNIITASFSPDQPGAGDWDYRLRITTNTDGGGSPSGELYISRTNADLTALVLKR